MTNHTTRDDSLQLTVHTITGEVTVDELIGLVKGFNENPTRLVQWDMSGAELSGTTQGDIRALIEGATTLATNRPAGKTAVIAPMDIQFGLGRMSEAYAEITKLPFELRVFRTEVEAQQWLLDE